MIKAGQVTTYTCDSANCVTMIDFQPVTHDANGNITAYGSETFTWDVRGRLKQFSKPGQTINFTYDPYGMRASKAVGGVTTTYLLDGDSVVREVIGGVAKDTLQGPTVDQPLARSGCYFTPNHLGSTTTLTDAGGTVVQSYTYGPFGETTGTGSEVQPFQYTGRERDESGLCYNRARYYRPEWGRFISEDPIGFEGGDNQYAYVANNPMAAIDPSGMTIDRRGYQQAVERMEWRARNPGLARWSDAFDEMIAVFAGILEFGFGPPSVPKLRFMHSDETIRGHSGYNYWKDKPTAEIVRSLDPVKKEGLVVYNDGVIANGNTRIRILMDRGFDVESLPRKIRYRGE